jgi:hypothetical protein
VSKEDPKHGRWILPVVIVALIGFTYLFVNALPPAEIPVGTTTTVVASETTTTVSAAASTTTTSLPPDIDAFLRLVDGYAADATQIQTDLDAANDAWENRADDVPSFGDTLAAFEGALVEAQTLSENVAATNPPDTYATVWPASVTAAEALPPGVQAVIDGLRAPDDGTARRDAVTAFDALTAEFLTTLDAVKSATP